MKGSEKFQDTQRMPFMLDKTEKKQFFFEKNRTFFLKMLHMPETLRSPLCSQNVSFLVKV